MNIRKREEKNIVVLYLEGKVDINSANLIEETSLLLSNGYSKLLCDFNNIDMVDYNGLSVIAIAYKNVINKGGIMKFSNIPVHIKELFKLVRLDLVLDIYDDEEDGIRSFEVTTKIDKLYLRRRFKRIELQIPVKYNLGVSTKPQIFTGKVLNISGEGLFIYSKHTFPISTQVDLELKMDGGLKILKLQGMVLWLADKELQPHCYPGMGVQFINLDLELQKRIIEFIDRHITHRTNL